MYAKKENVVPKEKIHAAPSVRRLPAYLHIIRNANSKGLKNISGTVIANELELEAIQVRKDLAITGIVGKPKKGYPVKPLIDAIEDFLGWRKPNDAILIGVGNLATALLGYQEFQFHGLHFVAAFDNDTKKIGTIVHGVPVLSLETLPEHVKNLKVNIAVITVPSSIAQSIADSAINAGIKGIWNFSNIKLKIPKGVAYQQEDLTSGYALLSLMMNNQNTASK